MNGGYGRDTGEIKAARKGTRHPNSLRQGKLSSLTGAPDCTWQSPLPFYEKPTPNGKIDMKSFEME